MRDDRQEDRRSAVEPGQIWLIEQAAHRPCSPLDRSALTSANVVIYDRALAPLVAELLPIHAYAEPLPREAAAAGGAVSRRAIEFAICGWRVVQLIAARPGRREHLHASAGVAGDLPVRVIAKAGPAAGRDASVGNLAGLIVEFAAEDALTLVFGPLAGGGTAGGGAFTANGLAG